jgi:hypothetical protein
MRVQPAAGGRTKPTALGCPLGAGAENARGRYIFEEGRLIPNAIAFSTYPTRSPIGPIPKADLGLDARLMANVHVACACRVLFSA